jgi:hypothetical protein
MEWCNYPFIQGIATTTHLDRQIYFLTGNPRYEGLKVLPQPENKLVLINVNFTYGIHDSYRDAWIEDIIASCESSGYSYWIAQHPRDPADLSDYPLAPSGAENIHETIKNSSIIVTRFSSLIHESIAIGRPVIYYNPHHERFGYDFGKEDDFLIFANDKEELNLGLEKLNEYSNTDHLGQIYQYVDRHLGSSDGLATTRIVEALNVVSGMPGRIEIWNDWIKKLHYLIHFMREC